MIKIYGMETCPDCKYVEEQVKNDCRYEIIDIGKHENFCACATATLRLMQ